MPPYRKFSVDQAKAFDTGSKGRIYATFLVNSNIHRILLIFFINGTKTWNLVSYVMVSFTKKFDNGGKQDDILDLFSRIYGVSFFRL